MMKTIKTYTISLIVLCLVFTHVNESIGQTQVTRYTPLGSPVTAYNNIPEMPSGDKEDWSAHISINYPNATELNPPSATTSYNCHAYAWHVSEGGDRVWIGYYQGQQDHEDIYWEDGSYIRLSSESEADKISYHEDNHSAIQTSTQGTYISKWGQGPLMQHARDYGPSIYQMNYRKYYDNPAISGDLLLCYPSSKTYSVQDFHNVNYSWSSSSNLQINGSSTGRSVSVSPASSASGSGYVRVSIDIQDYNKTREITKDIWIGRPQFTIVGTEELYPKAIGFAALCEYGTTDPIIVGGENDPGITNVQWSYSGPLDYITGETGINYRAKYAAGLTSGQGLIYADATNACGSVENNMYYSVEGWLRLFPNPTEGTLYVEIDKTQFDKLPDNSRCSLSIFDKQMHLRKRKHFTGYSTSVDVNHLPPDVYIVRVKSGEKTTETKIMVK